MWRGARGRCVADRLWLDRHPVPIQKRVRGVLNRKRFARIKKEVYTATLAISRCFRGFAGRRRRNAELYARESDALQNLAAASDEVVKTEARYLLLISESERCTPRAIASGYRDEMKGQIEEHRRMITSQKSETLFTKLIKHREAVATYEKNLETIARAKFLANEANEARDCELKAIWARESRTHHDSAALDKRRAIGDQKRSWRVKFYNEQGKPKKRIRPGDFEDMARRFGDEAEVYCGGGVDLFAFNDAERHRLGSEEALQALDDKIRLQSWLNQVEQVEELFMPLVEPLKRMHRATSVLPDLDAGGFRDVAAIGVGRHVIPTVHGVSSQEWDQASHELAPEAPSCALVVVPEPAEDVTVEDLEATSASTTSERTRSTKSRKHSTHFDVHETPVDAGANLAWRDPKDENAHARGAVVVPLATNLQLSKKVRRRKRERNVVSRIPWSLLDELDAEKERFAAQQLADTLMGDG
mmetsp:Transcript_17055/g.58781  ORF Transcript_17055/g.58781 Transcript_17055/m.58781 type:complete len:473 (-) Transcript_17055:366-1784(-)